MNFIKGKSKEFYLLTSEVENIFLNEYMPGAPGDYVKVYLFGSMYAQQREDMTHQTLARQLRLSEEDVDRAWTYWADLRAVKKHPRGNGGLLDYDIEFIDLREQMYGRSRKEEEKPAYTQEAQQMLVNNDVKQMISQVERATGKVLSARDVQEIQSWVKDFGASPELIAFAFSHYSQKGKGSVNYISQVIRQWREQGFETAADAQSYLEELERKYGAHKRVLQALGMNRNATEAEAELMDCWFDEMGFSLERVLEACARTTSISNPNLRYVNKILENWQQEAKRDGRDVNKKVTVTQTVLNKYYEFLRRKSEKEAQERKEQVYGQIPRVAEIDRTMGELGSSISRLLLSGDRSGAEGARNRMKQLEAERAILLTENNFTIDYTDLKYSCDLCRDTGVTEEGQRCTCQTKRIEEAELWQKTN